MCEFCVQHGEGKKWYLQTKNFAEELLNDVAKQYIINMFGKLEEDTGGRSSSPPQASSTVTDPAAAKAALLQRMEQQKKLHWGQVIPIEESEEETIDEELAEKLKTPIQELELSVRANNCLESIKIETIGQLVF